MKQCSVVDKEPDCQVLHLVVDDVVVRFKVPFKTWNDASVGAVLDLPIDDPVHPEAGLYFQLEW